MAARKKASAKSKSVVDALKRDLVEIGKRDKALADSTLAALALQLAAELDAPDNSATSKSMCARALLDALDRLRELMTSDDEEDGLDELNARRAARLAGGRSAA